MKKHTLTELTKLSEQHPIIAFDGVCNLCNAFIKWLIKYDKAEQFRYATLQSHTGEILNKELHGDLDSVLLLHKGKIYSQSDVALLACKILGGVWSIFSVFIVVPKAFRNLIYNWIAKNRYKWFGKSEACMIPTPEVKKLFL